MLRHLSVHFTITIQYKAQICNCVLNMWSQLPFMLSSINWIFYSVMQPVKLIMFWLQLDSVWSLNVLHCPLCRLVTCPGVPCLSHYYRTVWSIFCGTNIPVDHHISFKQLYKIHSHLYTHVRFQWFKKLTENWLTSSLIAGWGLLNCHSITNEADIISTSEFKVLILSFKCETQKRRQCKLTWHQAVLWFQLYSLLKWLIWESLTSHEAKVDVHLSQAGYTCNKHYLAFKPATFRDKAETSARTVRHEKEVSFIVSVSHCYSMQTLLKASLPNGRCESQPNPGAWWGRPQTHWLNGCSYKAGNSIMPNCTDGNISFSFLCL